jgi:hypothetical protein
MSSSPLASLRLPARIVLSSFLLTGLLWLACGRKEPPRPPASKVPAKITDLTVQQRGMEYLFTMTYPSATMGGLALAEIESVEIWEVVRVVSPLMGGDEPAEEGELDEESTEAVEEAVEEPEAAPEEEQAPGLFQLPTDLPDEEQMEDLVKVDPREFRQTAQFRWALRDAELSSAVQGGRLLIRLPIEEIPEQEEVSVFAARTVAGPRLVSPFSNLVKIGPRQPPSAPSSVSVTATATGVELTWEAAEEGLEHNVYRRDAKVKDYGPPLATVPPETQSFVDRSALFDNRYIYTVTAVSSTDPLVESRIVTEREVDYKDRFPPSAPENIVSLAEEARVRLLWEVSPESDVAGYRVFRQVPGEEFHSITPELVIGSELLDRDVASGNTYIYFVTAVDGANNQSEASKTTTAQVP